MIILSILLPVALSIECHEWYAGPKVGAASTCIGGACVLKYNFFSASVAMGPDRGCTSDANVTAGCWDSVNKFTRFCFCTINLCNSDKFSYPEANVKPAPSSSCKDPKDVVPCDSPSCVFSTDSNIDACPAFGEPTAIHEFFTNSIVIDQTAIPNKKNNLVPKSTFISHCDSRICTNLARKLSKNTNFTSAKRHVTCYSYQDAPKHTFKRFLNSSRNASDITCRGDFCYMSRYEGAVVRGCITVVDDSLAKKKMESGVYDYLKLHFYLCSTDYCNLDDVAKVKNTTMPLYKMTTQATRSSRGSAGTTTNSKKTTSKPISTKAMKTTTAPTETATKAAVPQSICHVSAVLILLNFSLH